MCTYIYFAIWMYPPTHSYLNIFYSLPSDLTATSPTYSIISFNPPPFSISVFHFYFFLFSVIKNRKNVARPTAKRVSSKPQDYFSFEGFSVNTKLTLWKVKHQLDQFSVLFYHISFFHIHCS